MTPDTIRAVQLYVGHWLNWWHRERKSKETTLNSPDLDELTSQLMTAEALQLNEGQVEFTVECVKTYLRIFLENYGEYPGFAMAGHSALLPRLLSGKPALPKPPPLRFAYPCYRLAEGEPVRIVELKEHTGGPFTTPGGRPRVEIDQHWSWEWIDKENGLLRHLPDGDVYHVDLERMEMQKATDSIQQRYQ